MADIFLSYSEKDRDTARRLADTLVAAGWTVWWDRRIPAGQTWRAVLERELQSMRCMVVLWSSDSVRSEWVCEEAAEGRQLGRLVPVALHRVRPPAGFRELQAADLVGWDGAPEAPGLRQLLDDIGQRIGPPGAAAVTDRSVAGARPAVTPRAAATGRRWWAGAATLLGLLALAGVYLGTLARPPATPPTRPAAAAATPPAAGPAVATAPASTPAATAVASTRPRGAATARAERPAAAPPSARCAALLERLSLGEPVSAATRTALHQECPP